MTPEWIKAGNRHVQAKVKLESVEQQGVVDVELGDPVSFRSPSGCQLRARWLAGWLVDQLDG